MADAFTTLVSIEISLPKTQSAGDAPATPGTTSSQSSGLYAMIRGKGVKTK